MVSFLTEQHNKLIRFPLLVLVCFLIATFLELHGSSIAVWDDYVPGEKGQAILAGKPRPIRSDEWAVQTPFFLAQLNGPERLQDESSAYGKGQIPLLLQLPVSDWISLIRPQHWGAFLLSDAQAFAWWWNFKWCSLLIGVFFLLVLLTRGDELVAISVSFLLLYSSFVQWWFSTYLVEMVGAFAFGLSFYLSVWRADRAWQLWFCLLGLLISAVNFALLLYPPFQIPLFHLGVVIAAADFLGRRGGLCSGYLSLGRWAAVLGVLVAALAMVGLVYWMAIDTIERVMGTVYPGQRVAIGGGGDLVRYLIGVIGPYLHDDRFPHYLGNVCEASSFILLWPIVAVAALVFVRPTGDPYIFGGLLLYLLASSAYLFVPFPDWLAQISLLSRVPATRIFAGVGVASWLVVAVWISQERGSGLGDLLRGIFCALIAGGTVGYVAAQFETMPGVELHSWEIWLAGFVGALLTLLLVLRWRLVFSALALAVVVGSNLLVNPVAQGIGAFTNKRLYIFTQRELRRDPSSRWIVVNGGIRAQFLKAAGATVLNGVNYLPRADFSGVLDPFGEQQEVYNRFAHVAIYHAPGLGRVSYHLDTPDSYSVSFNLCQGYLDELRITHVLVHGQLPGGPDCLEGWNRKRFKGKLRVFYRDFGKNTLDLSPDTAQPRILTRSPESRTVP